jgi:hypothetical protein
MAGDNTRAIQRKSRLVSIQSELIKKFKCKIKNTEIEKTVFPKGQGELKNVKSPALHIPTKAQSTI